MGIWQEMDKTKTQQIEKTKTTNHNNKKTTRIPQLLNDHSDTGTVLLTKWLGISVAFVDQGTR